LKIERIETEDLGDLAALYTQLIPHDPDVTRMQIVLEGLKENPNHIILGAKADGRLVGSLVGVVCGILFGKCKPFMVVEDVVVDTSERRRGVGRELMRELENQARERDCSYIILLTDVGRPEAQEFYEAIGYHSEAYRGFRKSLASNV